VSSSPLPTANSGRNKRKNEMDADEKILEINIEANEKHYNLTLVLISLVGWLVCLVLVLLIILGLLWLIGGI